MVAPKGPGHTVRRQYTEGQGRSVVIAIYQNPARMRRRSPLPGKGIGGTRAGVLRD